MFSEKDVKESQQYAPTCDTASALKTSVLSEPDLKIKLLAAAPINAKHKRVSASRNRNGQRLARPNRTYDLAVNHDFVGSQTVCVTRRPPHRNLCLVAHNRDDVRSRLT